MSKKKVGVKFQMESSSNDSSPGSVRRKNDNQKKEPKKVSVKSQGSKKITVEEQRMLELVQYLKSKNQPIVQNRKMIDDEERELLEQSGKKAIDLDGLLKFKEPKAMDKLWKIPYSFRDNSDATNAEMPDGEPSKINRFGTGINDGCFVSLSLPVQCIKKQKDWNDINKEADEALEAFEMAKMSRLNRTRRGSILQPTHVYLTPNPETGHTEYILGHSFLSMRPWQSEFHLDCDEHEQLLATEFKEHICENTSMDNIDNIPFADAGGGGGGSAPGNSFRDSEVQFMQAVQNRRRASLMPPRSGGGVGDLAFQRASFAGGALWSPNLERARRKAIYHEKVKLINPDYRPPDHEDDHQTDDEYDDDSDDEDSDARNTNDDEDDEQNNNDVREQDNNNNHSIEIDVKEMRKIRKKLSSGNRRSRDRSLVPDAGNDDDDVHFPEMNSGDRMRARLFAHELTLIVRQHFVSIKESEIVNYILAGHNVQTTCPNIKALLHFQNRVIRLISTFILSNDHLEGRVDAILFFLEVMRQLRLLGNWHSVNLMAQSLQCPPIQRLKETWRRLNFGYHDDYFYFMEMSENLQMGRECVEYEILTRFLPIFDDVLDKIREKCGLQLVLIQTNRQRGGWNNDENLPYWVDKEVENLKECVQKAAAAAEQAQQDEIILVKMARKQKKLPFFRRLLFCAGNPPQTKVPKRKESSQPVETFEPARQKMDTEVQLDENSNQQPLFPDNSLAKIPSCKKFWSLADYHKLSASNKELIKQEIVRTLVAFQKSAFYVFEDRDPELRDFLLNCRCESMNANMKRSTEVENSATKARTRNHESQSSENGITNECNPNPIGIDHQHAEQKLESRHGNRRVMFAEDFAEDENNA